MAAEQTLVDLDYDVGVREEVLAANVPAEALPIHQCVIAHVELVVQRIAGHVVVHPQIHQLDYGGERQVTFRKQSALPDGRPSSTRSAAPPRNAVVKLKVIHYYIFTQCRLYSIGYNNKTKIKLQRLQFP